MKVLSFNSSKKTANGNTHVVVDEFLKGIEESGGEVENIFLARKKIRPCFGCYSCWLKTPGKCIIKDDMAEILEKIKKCDVMLYATPVYVDNVSGIMKNFMDRLIPLIDPHFYKDETGECRHQKREGVKPPKLVVIGNSGFPERTHFQVIELLMKRLARNFNTEVVTEIYRNQGALLRFTEEEHIVEKVNKYKGLVREAGREFKKNMKVSDELMEKINQPFLPDDEYIEFVNKHWDRMIDKFNN